MLESYVEEQDSKGMRLGFGRSEICSGLSDRNLCYPKPSVHIVIQQRIQLYLNVILCDVGVLIVRQRHEIETCIIVSSCELQGLCS